MDFRSRCMEKVGNLSVATHINWLNKAIRIITLDWNWNGVG